MTATIAAATHPAEYLLHRYWARKPHNILAAYVRELVPPGGRVVDPFCGSGVLLSEAARAGLEAYGADINPIAVLLSRVTLTPPPLEAFLTAAETFLSQTSRPCAPTHTAVGGRT